MFRSSHPYFTSPNSIYTLKIIQNLEKTHHSLIISLPNFMNTKGTFFNIKVQGSLVHVLLLRFFIPLRYVRIQWGIPSILMWTISYLIYLKIKVGFLNSLPKFSLFIKFGFYWYLPSKKYINTWRMKSFSPINVIYGFSQNNYEFTNFTLYFYLQLVVSLWNSLESYLITCF